MNAPPPAAGVLSRPTAPTSRLANDHARQLAVESLGILDTPREERFDRITRLARQALGMAFVTISLPDHDRAWFKSSAGVDVDEAPLEQTFCQFVRDPSAPLVVRDTARDPRGEILPSEGGVPSLRFYAGQPVLDQQGTIVAVLCLWDTTPRELTPEQLVLLGDLARWTAEELTASAESEHARYVQTALLPEGPPDVPGYEVDGLCMPARAVGGDFYDYQVAPDHLGITLGDVMGKGTGAALLSVGVRSYVRAAADLAGPDEDLGNLLERVAHSLDADLRRTSSFVTMLQLAVHLPSGQVRVADAGHGLCLHVRSDGSATQVTSDGLPLGVLRDSRWQESFLVLEPGDVLLAFSDGLGDLVLARPEGLDLLVDLCRTGIPPHEIVDEVRRFCSRELALDDVTVVAVRRDAA
ncbi:PP2C family protein-serine/threonine phosphatase [Solicola sp. PLA-1-18]|uniref:PP2C family protein-serine/threonine phosphatase n=1 Tax=Solicola sp. PLA-1-18 TaxID=3380532 RepID=UPI003B7AFEA7